MKLFYLIPFLISTYLLTSFGKNNDGNHNTDKFVVVLDAGHGGHDPGNLGNGYLEKNIALNIVLKVGGILEKDPDIKVVYTRKDDTFIDLYVRGEIANKANADLFVSVHCDSHTSDAHGAGTFVLGLHANKQNFEIAKKENSVIYLEDNYQTRYAEYDINSPESVIGLTIMQEEFLDQSILLAKMIQDNFSNKLKRNDRKVKQAGFIVLHQTFMPSVLIETGFLTNKSEGGYLNSKSGQSEMGKAIAEAIMEYKNNVKSYVSEGPSETTAVVSIPKEEPAKEALAEAVPDKSVDTSKEPIGNKEPEVAKEVAIAEEIPKVSEEEVKKPEPEEVVKIIEEEPKKPVEETVVVEKEVITPDGTEKNAKPKADIVFKVQILASSKNLPLRSEDFKGLNKLSKESYKNLYRYMYGNASNHFDATLLKSNADAKGYTTSYIVAYKEGKRIPMSEALKYVSE